MKNRKPFLFLAATLSVALVVLLAVYALRRPPVQALAPPPAGATADTRVRAVVPEPAPSASARPSEAAQKRAKAFNDATDRFNGPENP